MGEQLKNLKCIKQRIISGFFRTINNEFHGFRYNIKEEKTTAAASTGDNNITTGTVAVTGNVQSSDATANFTYDTVKRSYGYEGSCTKLTTYDTDSTKRYAEQFDITNTLPVTKLQVEKTWVVDTAHHKYVGKYTDGNNVEHDYRDIVIDLTRSVQEEYEEGGVIKTRTKADTAFNSQNSTTNGHSVSFVSTDMNYLTEYPVLVYDDENRVFTYKAAEQDIQGYKASYQIDDPSEPSEKTDGQQVEAVKRNVSTDQPQKIYVTNTQITGGAEVVKIDKTYFDKYGNHEDYSDFTIEGAKFELYINKGTAQSPVYEAVNVSYEEGSGYTIKNDSTSNEVVSDSSGRIEFFDMPLNTYYLKETYVNDVFSIVKTASDEDVYYSFTIDVDSADDEDAQAAYTEQTESAPGFIGNGSIKNKIGNEEVVQKSDIKLKKTDKTSKEVLANATYYLLYLKPYSNVQTRVDAENALRNSGGSYTGTVEQYWDKIGEYRTNSSGMIYVPAEDVIFGEYAFLEVQPPVGYEKSCDGFTVTNKNGTTHNDMIFTLSESNISCEVVHEDPRKDADVKIYKQDEFGNPLNGAEFELWYRPDKIRTETSYTYTYNDNQYTIPQSSDEQQIITPRTDNDYIYFKDNYVYGSRWRNDSINMTYDDSTKMLIGDLLEDSSKKVYATFYSADNEGSKINTVPFEVWERFVHYTGTSTAEVIWKIQPPVGANYVRFHLDKENWSKYTERIQFVRGRAYYKASNNAETTTGTWNWTNTPGSTGQSYAASPNKLVFRRNHKYSWDNIHIEFFDENQQPLGESFPGYLMEPYGHAESNYRLDFGDNKEKYGDNQYDNLCYEITIPENAAYFRINNGVNESNDSGLGKYFTGMTPIDREHTDLKNNNNFWKFTESSWDVRQPAVLEKWSQYEIETVAHDNYYKTDEEKFEVDTDTDYVYFLDKSRWADSTKVMYAYYYGGNNLRANNYLRACYSVWPGVQSVGSFEYTVDGQTYNVYKFRKPMGDLSVYSSVIFNDGSGGHETGNIGYFGKSSYQYGYMYTNNSATDDNTGSISNSTQYADPNSTQVYTDRGDRLYVVQTDTDNLWDNLHVSFYSDEQGGQTGLQTGNGYVMQNIKYDSETGWWWYSVPIPDNAVQFSLNNGRDSGKTTARYDVESLVDGNTYNAEAYENRNDYTLNDIIVRLSATPESGIYPLDKLHPDFDEHEHRISVVVPYDEEEVQTTETVSGQTTDYDYDYIYFTNVNGWTDVKAYYWNGDDKITEWPGVDPVDSYTNEYSQTVYKFDAPADKYTNIIFNGSGGQTVDIPLDVGTESYRRGYGFYPNGTITSGKYECGNWQHSAPTSVSYDLYTGQTMKISISGTGWDDPHVYFLDKDGNTLAASAPGFMLEKASDGDAYYTIRPPKDAVKFVVNNGRESGSSYAKTTAATAITVTESDVSEYTVNDVLQDGKYTVTAESEPYVKPANEYRTGDVLLARVVTGDDGLTKYIKWLKPKPLDDDPESYDPADPSTYQAGTVDDLYLGNDYSDIGEEKAVTDVIVKNWGRYYWKEVSTPTGYTADEECLVPFEVKAEQADKTVNIISADNTRIKGKVTLTKTAKEASNNKDIGDKLEGARFELYRIGEAADERMNLKFENDVYYADILGSETYMTTDVDGRIHIESLEWGRYYLEEIQAPQGFRRTDLNRSGSNNRVYFTVGRNNCQTDQQLICRDEAQKAALKITKTIYERNSAWGDPTFIFRLRQTKSYIDGVLTDIPAADQREYVLSMTLTGNSLHAETDEMEIDPGRYEISEVNVSRYELKDWNASGVSDTDFAAGILSFTVEANDSAVIDYENRLAYYDKFSHSECTVNKFNGIKGIRVQYSDPVSTDAEKAEIPKSELEAYIIKADGSEITMTPQQKNSLSISWVQKAADDTRFGDKFSDISNQNLLEIKNPGLFSDGVYTLRAEYNGFNCEFEINFEQKDHSGSKNIRKVIFRADEENRSYLADGGSNTAQYEFIFTISEENSTKYIHKKTHNGTAVSDAEVTSIIANSAPETLRIVEGYDLEFSNIWIRNNTEISGLDYNELERIVLSAADDETIVFTAKLQDKAGEP